MSCNKSRLYTCDNSFHSIIIHSLDYLSTYARYTVTTRIHPPRATRTSSSIKPLERVVLGEDSPVRPTAVGLLLILGVNAVQRGDAGLVVAVAADESPEVDVGRAGVGHGGDAHLAEQVQAVGREADADALEVRR